MRDAIKPPREVLQQVSDTIWEIPPTYKKGMLVPARIYGTKEIIDAMDAGVYEQVTNVACLPGIQKYSYCMPDGHWGYGFPIGGVAAFDAETGIISPGGIGFDINCGMRLITTNLGYKEVRPKIRQLVDTMFKLVPAGVGAHGFLSATKNEFKEILTDGSKWCVQKGYGWSEDVERTEGYGKIDWADTSKVSEKAITRGFNQLGTLGSGNHYLEIQVAHASNIFEPEIAKTFGIHTPDQVVVMIHCGSRGFGHQIGTDYLRAFEDVMRRYNIEVRDKELTCAPFQSNEGQDYYKAMACAANMAFANRQIIMNQVRKGFSDVFKTEAEKLDMHMVYDVAHNIAKLEEHVIGGKKKKVVVHRKGSTRAFPPHHPELAPIYKKTGQPVIIGGSMETGSYLLVGTQKAMDETFGSTAHGSGRTMSRAQAKKEVRGDTLQQDMERRGIYVKAVSMSGLAEEAGRAYKDINAVINAVHTAGISKRVCRLIPVGNIKG